MTKAQTDVGKDTEQRLARWLRDHGGYPHADRRVKTGYTTANRVVVDAGDIDGCPGLVVQSKSLRSHDKRSPGSDPNAAMERAVPGWLLETEKQRQAADADLGLLVVRRWGTTNVGRWWCFLTVGALVTVTGGAAGQVPTDQVMPVRMELRHALALLHGWGWGEGVAEDTAA
jgi:hypothetical protein